MSATARRVARLGIIPVWALEVIERRRDWVLARSAIREDRGEDGWIDAREASALSAILAVGESHKPIAEAVHAAEVELHNLRQEHRKAQKSIAVYHRQQRRIRQLKRTLRENGIVVPREIPESTSTAADEGQEAATRSQNE